MTPCEQGWAFYREQWPDILNTYLANHFVYASPTALCLAKPQDGAWWIEFCAGDMKEAFGHLPYWLPQIAFARRGRARTYWAAKLVNKCLHASPVDVKGQKDDSVQDGSDDALSWWRWSCWQDKTASTAVTHYRSRECGQSQDHGQAA